MKYYCMAEYCVWRFRDRNRFACMFPGDICPKGICVGRAKQALMQQGMEKEKRNVCSDTSIRM